MRNSEFIRGDFLISYLMLITVQITSWPTGRKLQVMALMGLAEVTHGAGLAAVTRS